MTGNGLAPLFSVVIPSHNAARHIGNCINSVLGNAHDGITFEIVVADDSSTDGTSELAARYPVTVLTHAKDPERTIAALRNEGAEKTTGDVIAFLDSDMVVPQNWLKTAKEYFDSGLEGALGFVDVPPDSAGWVGRTWGKYARYERDHFMDVDLLTGRNIFIKRSVFNSVHGFDKTMTTAEDKDLTLRLRNAGYRVVSAPDVMVLHMGFERNLSEFMKKEFWRQSSSLTLARRHGYTLRSLRNPLLSSWHLLLCLFTCFSVVFGPGQVILLFFLLWTMPSVLIVSIKLGRHNNFGFFMPFVFLTFLRWNVSGVALVRQLVRSNAFMGNR